MLRWRPVDDPLVIGRHDGLLRGLDDGRFLSVEDYGFTVLSLGSSG